TDESVYHSWDENGKAPPFCHSFGYSLWMLIQIYGLALGGTLILYGAVLALEQYMIGGDVMATIDHSNDRKLHTWTHWRAVLWLTVLAPSAMSIPFVSLQRVFGSDNTRDISSYNFGFFFGLIPALEFLIRGFYGNGKVWVEVLTCILVFG